MSQKLESDFSFMIHEPKIKSGKAPVVILLHGYGVNEKDLYGISTVLNDQLLAFTLRAPYPVQDTSFCWFGMQFLPEKKFAFNYPQAQSSRHKILDFIKKVCTVYEADSNQVFILGCSQGSMMAYDLALSAPEKIKGVIILSGMMMPENREMLKHFSHQQKPAFFIAHGSGDEVIDVSEGELAEHLLKTAGFNTSIKKYNMGHDISIDEIIDIQLWLRSRLKN